MSKSRRKNTRKRNSRSRNTGIGIVSKTAIIMAPLAALGVGGYLLSGTLGEETMDKQFCYQRADQHQVAISIDNSLRDLQPAQLRDYRAELERAYSSTAPNARIMIFTTAADRNGSVVKPAHVQCKPAATASQQAALDAPEKPAPHLKRTSGKAWAAYNEAIDAVMNDVQSADKVAGDSPILEQVRAVAQYDGFQGASRSLTLITDGVQNSRLARFCNVAGDMPVFSRFAKRQDYPLSIQPRSFSGMGVSLLLVENSQLTYGGYRYCTGNELQQWWHDYFTANGAAHIELTPSRYWVGAQ